MNTENLASQPASKLSMDQYIHLQQEVELEATLEEWANFMRERNLDGVLSVYSENAVNFDLMAPLQYQGVETIRERLSKWFNTFSSDIVVDIEDLTIRAEGTVGFAHCLIRYMGDKKDSLQGEDMYNRVSFGFEKIDNDWLIAHEHNSLPFNMQNGKVLIDLKPH